MSKYLFLFCATGCLGITAEIFFTAVYDILQGRAEIPLMLKGQSYIWMFPIYGLAGILFPPIIKRLKEWHVLLRMCLYATGILAVEFITGWLLDITTGQCPWEYKEGWHVLGYIRIDYFPLWALFGLLVEKTLRYLMRLEIQPE
ncbi:MAG: hypothetical protein KatS3mg031_1979 [Chitinophagales bacterium]|nr:MAG: hypothetical protein KatS3mg031_1979 [Chitinophagales bacterium]